MTQDVVQLQQQAAAQTPTIALDPTTLFFFTLLILNSIPELH